MMIFFLLFSTAVFANPMWKWTAAMEIVEKHEFYGNNEMVDKPKDSWEILFGVIYKDSQLTAHKDCLFYRVPGNGTGVLKIRQIEVREKCEDFLFKTSDQEWSDLKALQYQITPTRITLYITHQDFRSEIWNIPLFNVFTHPKPAMEMSSAEYRSPKIIFLTPHKEQRSVFPQKNIALADKKVCHEVSEDCAELSPSSCSQCPEGWYEIPNGCPQGPKFCGRLECGQKNQPACRRGMKYLKKEKEFNCRGDHSFAYCAKGLRVQCEGALPYCI